MIGYKLFRRRRDGSLGPLFINRKQRVPVGEWLEAEAHRTKGYAFRPGWHACMTPYAPHLRQGGDRVWARVELEGCEFHDRPAAQGGTWILAGQGCPPAALVGGTRVFFPSDKGFTMAKTRYERATDRLARAVKAQVELWQCLNEFEGEMDQNWLDLEDRVAKHATGCSRSMTDGRKAAARIMEELGFVLAGRAQ